MSEIKSNSTKFARSLNQHKLLLFIVVAIFAIALALPATLGFANETTQDGDLTVNEDTYTISGHLYDAEGQPVTYGGVMIFGVYEDLLDGWSTQVPVESDGSYSCNEVPEGLIFGAMIGVVSDYANQFLSLPSETKTDCDFHLKPGAGWSFSGKVKGLESYAICGGTSIVTADGKLIEWTSLMPSITIEDIPEISIYPGATISESIENKTLTYHYESPDSPEEYTFVFVARAKSEYKFDKWLINNEEITEPYVVKKDEIVKISPSFVLDPNPPVPGEVRAYMYEDYARPPLEPVPITNGYAYIIGLNPETGKTFESDYGLTDENGLFKIKDVPEDIIGLLVVGAPGHTNRAQYYSSLYPATNFYLSRGVQCTVDIPDEVETVMLEKGSYVDITFDDFPMGKLELPEDIDFGKYILPFGMSFHGTFNFKDDGELTFSVDKNAFQINHLELNFKVVPKEGYVQNGWLKDGQKISGEYTLQDGEKDFTIAPNFGSDDPDVPDNPQEPTVVNAQTFDSLSTCMAVLAFLLVASAGVVLYRRLARKK